MAVGDRIKRARNLRGMTQKELGIAIGFEEKSADIRIAQYESNTRTPKEELLRKIAEVLDVNYRSLYEPTLYAAEDVMYTLFELDEHYPGTRLYEVTDTTDPDFPEKHMAVSFRYRLLDEFLKEWQLRKKQPSAAWCCGKRCRTQPPWECCRTPCGRPRYPEYQRGCAGEPAGSAHAGC